MWGWGRKSITLLEGSLASPAPPSDRNSINLKVKVQSVPRSKHSVSVIKINQLMLYREVTGVCSEIHTKHIHTLRGQNVKFVNVKLAVHIVTNGL